MQIFENDSRKIFLVFCITIFSEKAQNKIKQSRDQDDFFINDENT